MAVNQKITDDIVEAVTLYVTRAVQLFFIAVLLALAVSGIAISYVSIFIIEFTLWTLILTFFGIFYALYLVVKAIQLFLAVWKVEK